MSLHGAAYINGRLVLANMWGKIICIPMDTFELADLIAGKTICAAGCVLKYDNEGVIVFRTKYNSYFVTSAEQRTRLAIAARPRYLPGR